jgi:hypothetical protein
MMSQDAFAQFVLATPNQSNAQKGAYRPVDYRLRAGNSIIPSFPEPVTDINRLSEETTR